MEIRRKREKCCVLSKSCEGVEGLAEKENLTNHQKGTILFIDEIHTIVGAGKTDGAMDAGNLLKPMLARGVLRTIGATTINEYRKSLKKTLH